MDQRDKDGVLMINVSEGNNHFDVIEPTDTDTNYAHEVTESQNIISLKSNSREDENTEIVSENKSINSIVNLGKDNDICEHESDCATVTSPPPVNRPPECQCNCHCQSSYINSAFQYEPAYTSGKITASTFNNETERSRTPSEDSFHAISIDGEENSEGISNNVVLEYNKQSNSVMLANSSNSSKNEKTNSASKKPPSYNKLGGLILDDEPPKYEKVTGIKLHDELDPTSKQQQQSRQVNNNNSNNLSYKRRIAGAGIFVAVVAVTILLIYLSVSGATANSSRN